MNFVIPMAGRGARFASAGYTLPKMMIEAHGKTLLEWSVDSLPLELCSNLVFIGLREHAEAHGLEAFVRKLYGNAPRLQFLWLDGVTRGQSETVLKAAHLLDPDLDLLVFNIDTRFHSQGLAAALRRPGVDGVLGSFDSGEARFSFAATDPQGWVTRVTEKEPISRNALTGMYHFRRCGDFLDCARAAIAADDVVRGEFYIAPLYNRLLARGRRFTLCPCEDYDILGTPGELALFESKPSPEVSRQAMQG